MRKLFLVALLLLLAIGSQVAAQGGTLQYGTVTTGSITADTPSITYSFNANAGDFATINVIATTQGLDPNVNILGPSGSPIASNDNLLSSYGALDAGASLILPETGMYLIIVGRTATSTPQGTFLIRLNGTSVAAQPLTQPTTTTLDPVTSPVQVYTLTGISVTLSGDGNPYRAELIGANGQTVAILNGQPLGSATLQLPDPTTTYQLVLSTTAQGPVNVSLGTDGSAPPPTSQTSPGTTTTTTTTGACSVVAQGNGLNVRSGPGTDYDVITTLVAEQQALVQGVYAGWYQVNANGQTGWAAASVVVLTGNCNNIPAVNPPAAPTSAAPPTSPPQPTSPQSDTSNPTSVPPPTSTQDSNNPPPPPATTEEVAQPTPTTATAQVADDSGGDPVTLQIQRGETRSVSGSVSTPEGDRIDRVNYRAPVGSNVRLTIVCTGTNVENTRFSITRSDNQSVQYGCGQVYEYTANVQATANGSIQIEAISNPSYVEWTILGEGF